MNETRRTRNFNFLLTLEIELMMDSMFASEYVKSMIEYNFRESLLPATRDVINLMDIRDHAKSADKRERQRIQAARKCRNSSSFLFHVKSNNKEI